jgi:hypothetical protein
VWKYVHKAIIMTWILTAAFTNAKITLSIITTLKSVRPKCKLVLIQFINTMTPQVDTVNLVRMDISLIVIQMSVKNFKKNVLKDSTIILLQIFACIASKIKFLTMLLKNVNLHQQLVHKVNISISQMEFAKHAVLVLYMTNIY